MSRSVRDKIIWVCVFSIAMGFLEAAVVVYLRDLYYPNGFAFPLTAMSGSNAVVELMREAATIVMLAGVGVIAGQTANQRFAFFLGAFAIWDIFYYVFLKLILGWPSSILTWDILFLIPVAWVGPVITPCIISFTMILLSTALLYRDADDAKSRLAIKEWSLLVLGSLVVIGSWTWEYVVYSISLSDQMEAMATYVPQYYSWWIFVLGEGLLLLAVYSFWSRTR